MSKLCIIGVITISDRASNQQYQDLSGPAIENWLQKAIKNDWQKKYLLIPDEQHQIEQSLKKLVAENCSLILTTGGTGPSPRDITPEATENVCQKMLPGFGELMRMHSLKYVPTSILARQTAGICQQSLIVNLPGKPKAIGESLEAVFPAIPYCLDLIGGSYIETNDNFCRAFRPKK